jgi:hypothetical protein
MTYRSHPSVQSGNVVSHGQFGSRRLTSARLRSQSVWCSRELLRPLLDGESGHQRVLSGLRRRGLTSSSPLLIATRQMHSISIIIPAYNSGEQLTECLQAIRESSFLPLEIIVVDDSSTDDTRERAVDDATYVLDSGGRRGPGSLGISVQNRLPATFFFLSTPTSACGRDTIERIAHRFDSDPTLDAVIGSYDRFPRCWDFLSQYRNLMHAYVHQNGEAHASNLLDWVRCRPPLGVRRTQRIR